MPTGRQRQPMKRVIIENSSEDSDDEPLVVVRKSKKNPNAPSSSTSSSLPESSTSDTTASGDANQPSTSAQADVDIEAMHAQKKVDDLIKFLLISANKNMCVNRNAMKKAIGVDNARKFSEILARATEDLTSKFGYTLREVYSDKFLLVKKCENGAVYQLPQEMAQHLGLVWLIACSIVMNGGAVPWPKLMDGLNVIGLSSGVFHPTFGDVAKLLQQDLQKQGFFKVVKEPVAPGSKGDGLQSAKVTLGFRSEALLNKKSVLKFVADLFETEPTDWKDQYQAIYAEAEDAA